MNEGRSRFSSKTLRILLRTCIFEWEMLNITSKMVITATATIMWSLGIEPGFVNALLMFRIAFTF